MAAIISTLTHFSQSQAHNVNSLLSKPHWLCAGVLGNSLGLGDGRFRRPVIAATADPPQCRSPSRLNAEPAITPYYAVIACNQPSASSKLIASDFMLICRNLRVWEKLMEERRAKREQWFLPPCPRHSMIQEERNPAKVRKKERKRQTRTVEWFWFTWTDLNWDMIELRKKPRIKRRSIVWISIIPPKNVHFKKK